MEKKRWLTGKKVAGIIFLLFLIDVSCYASWYVINNPPAEAIPAGAIRIGLAIDSTHYSGMNSKRGAEMAVDEINAEGGVDVGGVSTPLAIIVEETEEMKAAVGVERTISAVTKLITTHKVNVVMGGFATPMAALEVCARYRTIYICTASSDDPVTETVIVDYEKYKYVFSTGSNSTQLGMAMTGLYEYLMDTYGFTKVAIIAEEYLWADPIIKYFEEHKPEGMEIVYKVRFPATTTTFMPFLTEAQKADAHIVMPTIALDWGVTFNKEWSKMKVGLTAGLLVVAERTTFWEETDGAAEYHLEIQGGIPKSNVTEKSFNFYNGFEERYDDHPMYCAEWTYSAVYAYADAVKRAGTLDTEAVIAELEETDMITPYSRLRWEKGSHSPIGGEEHWPTIISQWRGPGYRPAVWSSIDPLTYNGYVSETLAYATLKLPPWRPSLK